MALHLQSGLLWSLLPACRNRVWQLALPISLYFIPSLFTIFVGMKADRTKKKANWLIRIGYLQAILFILIALMTKIPGYLAFSIVCFLNIVSDCLSDYRGGLQLPIMKKNILDEDLMEAYSFNQLLSMVCSISGQALGVWLLAISHQFCPGRFDQCRDFFSCLPLVS